MENTGGVRLDLVAIELDLEKNGHDDCHVEFVPDLPGGSRRSGENAALVAAVTNATGTANGDHGDHGMWGGKAVLTLDGASVTLKDYWGPESLVDWLTAFCRELRQQGQTGLVHATPLAAPPRWLYHGREPRATAFVALEQPLTEPSAAELWCRRAVAWAARDGGDAYLHAGAGIQHDPFPDVAAHLGAGLRIAGDATLTYLDAAAVRATRVRAEEDGLAGYQAYDPAGAWSTLVARAREALLAEADRSRLAFVAMTPGWAHGWEHRGRELPPLPTVDPVDLRRNTPVWSRHVPDAHGIQLLSRAHLDRARDLSGWEVAEAAPGRFLVEARDPSAWFATGSPSLPVIGQARADFGDLIVPSGAVGRAG